jgi:hypothetical protein
MRSPAPDRPSDHFTSQATFLAIWLAPQLAALALSAFRVPLWARFPQAGELLALPLLLAVQVAAASMMLPLFSDWTKAAMALLAAWPMASIAASLSAARLETVIGGEMNVALWMIATSAAAISCRSPRSRAAACVVAIMWTVGGGLLLYLRLEFRATGLPAFVAGPLVATVSAAMEGSSKIFLPLPPLTFLLLILSFFQTRPAHKA